MLVGSWHRDEAGPFVKIIESIRGEGAETRFAEVTFTHQTWAKINAEMDTKYARLSIVGWYHTHPDFGIFLSDRDRFIHEHFFSGPGQIAHVIDPIRKIEGVFVWRDAKPVLSPHFWVGDRIMVADIRRTDGSDRPRELAPPASCPERWSPPQAELPGPEPDRARALGRRPDAPACSTDHLRRCVLAGIPPREYSLGMGTSAVCRERAGEQWFCGCPPPWSRGRARPAAAAIWPRSLVRSRPSGAESKSRTTARPRSHDRLAVAAQRVSAIKDQYGNTPAEDELLRRFLRDKLTEPAPTRSAARPGQHQDRARPRAARLRRQRRRQDPEVRQENSVST